MTRAKGIETLGTSVILFISLSIIKQMTRAKGIETLHLCLLLYLNIKQMTRAKGIETHTLFKGLAFFVIRNKSHNRPVKGIETLLLGYH